ncbi:MAG: hypothetical protein ABIH82_01090 [Candidatus Woesearchaeota archaeon]
MLIDLSQPRKHYFKRWNRHQILGQFVDRERILNQHILELNNVAVATVEADLEALLDGVATTVDHFETIGKVKSADRDTLIVLPDEYRRTAGDSRRLIAYKYNSLLPLNRFMQKTRKASEVLRDAFSYLHQQRDDFVARDIIGWSWTGPDHLLRVVPLMNDIKGHELRAFQNLAWYQLSFPEFDREIKEARVTGNLDSRKEGQLRRYQNHLASLRREGQNLQHFVDQLNSRQRDLIRQDTNFERGLVMNFIAPSRSDVYKEYNVKICNVPLGDHTEIMEVWSLYGECYCLDKNYRSDRRGSNKEFYFCPHEISALQGLKAKLEYAGERERIHSLPFPLPTRSLIDFIDKLRYRTLIADVDQETKKATLRPLNDTEIGVLAMKKIIAEGYDTNATADMHVFRRQRYDPTLDLIKFREAV